MYVKGSIYQGTDHEITWGIDEPITPELVDKIKEAGRNEEIKWKESRFFEAASLLVENYEFEELEEKIYDEDPDIIEFISLIISSPMDEQEKDLKKIARLYLPVVLVIIEHIENNEI